MADSNIPTVDLSPFIREGDHEDGKKKAREVISQACSQYGFFQIQNHGLPPELLSRALELSKTFFEYSDYEKRKSSPGSGVQIPAGYNKQPQHSLDKNEYLVMFPPESGFNVYPRNPPEFKEVLEDVFSHLTKLGSLIESTINECLGLPPNFLKEFNHDRSWDLMSAKRYFPATETENNGISEHEDGNCVTFVLQDQIGGLQVKKNGEWIPVTPAQDTVVVNLGDVIQVLSNNKFKSATHRVVRQQGKSRYSYAFFYNLHGDNWVEPLSKFTEEIGETPKYRGFLYKDYQALRIRNKTHPPDKPEDVIHITHYAVTS
ncbi:hypothetical protein LWI28_013040 [Acer negundo]|uniref:Fe2OG dioxygenase domain-containing protein n=1 Tax=Acer negundo TaxID=4023 RepID=A0AAD5IQZ1_ACENE|nr:hypothetical protein LWI28_013040 [Acer negundo]KAK4844520.1 hypothetical protein QYF36_021205 [Acer negundo]